MTEFYSQLQKGDRLDCALRHAQLKMLAVNRHPYYWAAFKINGTSSNPLRA
jgi:CHAT domain-containing protein